MSFKLMIENTLQRIDNFFKEKSQKDVYMIYIIIVAILFFLAYPFYDSSVNEFNSAKKKVEDITKKIDSDKIYLKINTEEKVAKLVQEIKNLENELLVQKDNNKYIKEKIETIYSLIYDEIAWGEYLNSISVNAKEHNVKIIKFEESYPKNETSTFGHVLDVELKVKGNYLNTVKFINSLEKSELVVDVHDLSIKAQNELSTDLNISIWGITY